ncbi:hypothetical protein HPP92_022040 [Vanilla planifolia]|uniref:Uncharacterized protein n=1 Tax=Vanilla planifolia TaxID=51239 RepID=A0A835PWN4_VANPL|nr:hypothetical protein HPP92_022040 [Vanilla planifolia]
MLPGPLRQPTSSFIPAVESSRLSTACQPYHSSRSLCRGHSCFRNCCCCRRYGNGTFVLLFSICE